MHVIELNDLAIGPPTSLQVKVSAGDPVVIAGIAESLEMLITTEESRVLPTVALSLRSLLAGVIADAAAPE